MGIGLFIAFLYYPLKNNVLTAKAVRQDGGHQEGMTWSLGLEFKGRSWKGTKKDDRPQLSSWTWQRRWREKTETAPQTPFARASAKRRNGFSSFFFQRNTFQNKTFNARLKNVDASI